MTETSMVVPISRTRRSAWSLTSGYLLFAVTALTAFLAPPWLLPWLGSERFGAYKALLDWTSYLALLEFGIGGALLGSLASKLAQRDASTIRHLLGMGSRAYMGAIPGMLLAGFVLVAVLPRMLHLRSVGVHELRVSALILLVPLLFSPLLVFRSLAEAQQRNYYVNLLSSFQLVLTTALWLAAARAGLGLPGQSWATAAGQILVLAILVWSGMRAYGMVFFQPYDREATEVLRGLRWPTFVHSITDRVGLVSDNVIVAWMLGATAVSPFYLTQQLPGAAQFLLRGLGNATWAGLAELTTMEGRSRLQPALLDLTSIVSGLGLVFLVPIAAFNHHFVRLWVGPSNYAGSAVTVMTCVNVWLWSIYSLWGWLLLGTGHIARWVPYAAASTVVNLVISVIATRFAGMVGPVVGTLAAFLLLTSWALPRVLHRVFQLSPVGLWRTVMEPWKWGAFYTAGLWILARMQPRLGWFQLSAEMGAASLAGVALWWIVGLDRQGRTLWTNRARDVLGYR